MVSKTRGSRRSPRRRRRREEAAKVRRGERRRERPRKATRRGPGPPRPSARLSEFDVRRCALGDPVVGIEKGSRVKCPHGPATVSGTPTLTRHSRPRNRRLRSMRGRRGWILPFGRHRKSGDLPKVFGPAAIRGRSRALRPCPWKLPGSVHIPADAGQPEKADPLCCCVPARSSWPAS